MVIKRYKQIIVSVLGRYGVQVLQSLINSKKEVLVHIGGRLPSWKLNTSNRPIQCIFKPLMVYKHEYNHMTDTELQVL